MFRTEKVNQDFKQKGFEYRELDTDNVKFEGPHNLLIPSCLRVSEMRGQEHDVRLTPPQALTTVLLRQPQFLINNTKLATRYEKFSATKNNNSTCNSKLPFQ